MMNKEDIFNEIKSILSERGQTSYKVEKAYNLASSLHKGQTRNDGAPYINHPMEVALILAQVGFDEDCICAGILHDTVEDCGYLLEDVEKEFGTIVARIVDAVSEITSDKFDFSEENQKNAYVEKQFEHETLDEATFNKLISLGKKEPLAFYVKFADRLHNLRTLKGFPVYKQLEKVRQTEQWVLPIAEKMQSNYFFKQIKNECFKIENSRVYEDFWYIYNNNLEYSKRNIKIIIQNLKKIFSQTNKNIKVEYDLVKEYEVFDILKQKKYLKNLSNISENQISMIPLYNIYVIEPTIENNKRFSFIYKNKMSIFSKLIDANIDKMTGDSYMVLCDNSRVLYNVFHLTSSEYMYRNIGTDQYLNEIDEKNTHEIIVKQIKVKTRSGEVRFIAENSTVLDFAFSIHDDLGFSFDYASINSRTKMPPYKKLNNGDWIEIFTHRDENNKPIYCPKFKWLAYVNTESAKKKLIKYFEKLYNTK